MLEEKAKQRILSEIIALPPLRMVLMHASDEHVSKAALMAAINKIASQLVITEKPVDSQAVRRLIEHLEKKL
jgi:ribosomal protein L19E